MDDCQCLEVGDEKSEGSDILYLYQKSGLRDLLRAKELLEHLKSLQVKVDINDFDSRYSLEIPVIDVGNHYEKLAKIMAQQAVHIPRVIEFRKPVKFHKTIVDDFRYAQGLGLIYGINQGDHFFGDTLIIVKQFNTLAEFPPIDNLLNKIKRTQLVGLMFDAMQSDERSLKLQFELSDKFSQAEVLAIYQNKQYRQQEIVSKYQVIDAVQEEELDLMLFHRGGVRSGVIKWQPFTINRFIKYMNYIDQGDTVASKSFMRKSAKKNSLFYKQSILEKEEFQERYERNVDNLQIFTDDGYLEPFKDHFKQRNGKFFEILEKVLQTEGSLKEFARGYEKYGFFVRDSGTLYREWAPGVKEMYLTGDFNDWRNKEYPGIRDEFGNWEVFVPCNEDGSQAITHKAKVRAYVLDAKDQWHYKIPTWIKSTVQNEENKLFDGLLWTPEEAYEFKHARPKKPRCLKIYECHIGMAGVEPRVHTFKEFTQNVLPRVAYLGYNTIQIMAIQEHAYYGSFGYHVTNFFAVSSRFGTPEDLKQLIDTAHSLGIIVLMDLVHSHASSNVQDGINNWDGTDYQYFHAGGKGKHDLWDSQLFDYGKWEVLRFLLSNLSWWITEYQFDGFRFDGITSMLYKHHGMGVGFSGTYNEYFGDDSDMESLIYLMLANDLVHELVPEGITIAEDVSGYPTLCRTLKEGGIGFDYRMQMAVPDKWIKLLKEVRDEDWDMDDIIHTLTNRRYLEKCICYAECHDQALVGDKTLAMWLFDAEIYHNMTKLTQETPITFRGMALHKMIRLLTFSLGGEGYLTFMGNEFGHPEWIDFPREGNQWSYHHARRRFDLADDPLLRFNQLLKFDQAMIALEEKFKWLPNGSQYVSLKHNGDKVVAFERGDLLFVFNFHTTQSFEHYRIGTSIMDNHVIVLDTDQAEFGGHGRINNTIEYPVIKEEWCNRPAFIQIYLPAKSAIVLHAKI